MSCTQYYLLGTGRARREERSFAAVSVGRDPGVQEQDIAGEIGATQVEPAEGRTGNLRDC